MATYLWQAVGGTLLDDPGWVYAIPDGVRLHTRVPDFRAQLQQSLVVKAPRFNERLLDVLSEFPDARAVVMVRKAEDVLASILQKTRRARAATRMLNFDRFGPYDSVVEGFLNEYRWYMHQTKQAVALQPERLKIVLYEGFFHDPGAAVKFAVSGFGPEVVLSRVRVTNSQLGPLRNKPSDGVEVRGPGCASLELPSLAIGMIRKRTASDRDDLIRIAKSQGVLFGEPSRSLGLA